MRRQQLLHQRNYDAPGNKTSASRPGACCVPPYPMLDGARRFGRPLLTHARTQAVWPNRWIFSWRLRLRPLHQAAAVLLTVMLPHCMPTPMRTTPWTPSSPKWKTSAASSTASADFRRLLDSPLIDVKTATAASQAMLEQEGFSKPVRDFVGVIAANRRLRALPEIVAAFAALVAHRRGIVTAHVASAHPLNDVQRQQLRARLIEAGYGNVNILEEVEPDLLGGLVVRIGARLYDTSLKSRLQRLQYAMKGAA